MLQSYEWRLIEIHGFQQMWRFSVDDACFIPFVFHEHLVGIFCHFGTSQVWRNMELFLHYLVKNILVCIQGLELTPCQAANTSEN